MTLKEAKQHIAANPRQERTPLVVFVHGIFSTAESAFGKMNAALSGKIPHLCALYDYDFHRPLVHNGRDLATALAGFNDTCDVTLVCHSMGGLVGRLAVLTGRATCVRRLIMLGTPNFGALRTAQLGLLAQLALNTSGLVYGVFRKTGVLDLTRVAGVFREPIEKGAHHADPVEYITIPGEFFHDGRRFWQVGEWGEWNAWTATFAAGNVASEVLSGALPLWKVGLEKPHDGIVEKRSNSFLPVAAGRHSEKDLAIQHGGRFGRTYAHIEHRAAEDLTHVAIQHDDRIIAMVKAILEAPSLDDWYAALDREALRKVTMTRA